MKVFELNRFALSVSVTAVSLAGCGGSQVPIAVPGSMPQTPATVRDAAAHRIRPAWSYKVLHNFGLGFFGLPDGISPQAGLIDVKGLLYGTTSGGGSYNSGTVFAIGTGGGLEDELHSFGSTSDGDVPEAGLLDVNGTLYGTTTFGPESYGEGTVFSITTGGAERVLYSFGGSHGELPAADLIDVNGTLYSTTEYGGKYGEGTVFSITTSGTEQVLYSFGSNSSDGEQPQADLIDVNGTLYGTTTIGGTYAKGTVFSITTRGTEQVLHSFGKGSDGEFPYAGLIDVNGTLYGTTVNGGRRDDGTLFSISTAGKEQVLHSFPSDSSDGEWPQGDLIDVNGALCGTTQYGGTYGDGTVFSITTGGTEQVLHNFGSGSDGTRPQAGLLDANGTLYGTTVFGGTYNEGTVYALSP